MRDLETAKIVNMLEHLRPKTIADWAIAFVAVALVVYLIRALRILWRRAKSSEVEPGKKTRDGEDCLERKADDDDEGGEPTYPGAWFTTLAEYDDYNVEYNELTGVMYMVSCSCGVATVMVNQDGTPMLYDEELEKQAMVRRKLSLG